MKKENRYLLVLLALLLVGLLAPGSASAQGDVTPPEILFASIEPKQVDTSNGPATLYVTIHARDDLSGIQRIYYRFQPIWGRPNSGQLVDAYTDKLDAECSGTPNDMTCKIPIEIPQYAATGEWVPKWIFTKDKVNNMGDYDEDATSAHLRPTFLNEPFEPIVPVEYTDHIYLPSVVSRS